jgi:hypothetical protein
MAPGAGRQPARRAGQGLLGRLILLPFKILQSTFQLAGAMVNYSLAVVNVIGDRTLPGPWMRGIRGECLPWQDVAAACNLLLDAAIHSMADSVLSSSSSSTSTSVP